MNKVKNFFKLIGKWLKRAWIAVRNFFKENVWAGVLAIVVVILLFILVVQGIVKGIDKCNNKTSESNIPNRATTLTSSQVMEKLNNGDSFILFMGANTCAHCKEFYKTINQYVSSGNTVYYIDLADSSDPTLSRYSSELEERLLNDIPEDRNIKEFATPTTVLIQNGEFVDAVQGAYGMSGGADYVTFCDVMAGEYIGKPTYTFQSAAAE